MASTVEATLLERYQVDAGPAARFRLASGVVTRLEPREHGVVLGWTAETDFMLTAARIGEFAVGAKKVFLASGEQPKEPRSRGSRLAVYLLSLPSVELVRVDQANQAGASLIWEKDEITDGVPELSVITETWTIAAELATKLGAEEVGRATPDLVARLAS